MAALTNTRHELFAQALARGMTQGAAYGEAGYKQHGSSASRLAGQARIRTRVAELIEGAPVRGPVTIAQAIDNLLRLAEKGEALKTPAGLASARACLVEAVKLSAELAKQVEAARPPRIHRPMSRDEWLSIFAPPPRGLVGVYDREAWERGEWSPPPGPVDGD